MKLAPFFLQKHETSLLCVYRLAIFLSDGGRGLWEIGNEQDTSVIRQEYLLENGLVAKSIHLWNDIYFAELDPSQTQKSSFYTWDELQEIPEKKREDCFRTFTFCFEHPQEKLWFHSEVCKEPFEGRHETPLSLFQGLKDTCYNKV